MVALLEYPYADAHWYQFGLDFQHQGHNIEYFGIIDERGDIERLITYLQTNPVQVLIGIPPQALPDRGTMRKLDMIAKNAKGGLIVQLLDNPQGFLPSPTELEQIKQRKAQWETALAERQIALVRID